MRVFLPSSTTCWLHSAKLSARKLSNSGWFIRGWSQWCSCTCHRWTRWPSPLWWSWCCLTWDPVLLLVVAVTGLTDLTDLIAAHRLVQLRLEAQHLGPQSVGTVHQLCLRVKYQLVCCGALRGGGGRIVIIDWAGSDHLSWPPCQLCSSHQHCSVAPPPSGSLQYREIIYHQHHQLVFRSSILDFRF